MISAHCACIDPFVISFTIVTGIGRFQYLGIDRINIGGHMPFQNSCCPAPCSEAAPTPMRVYERMCVCVFLFPVISSNLQATQTHLPAQCAPRHTVVQARKNVIDNVRVQYYIAADREKT